MIHSKLSESIISILNTKYPPEKETSIPFRENFIAMSEDFSNAYDKNERTAAVTSIALLILSNVLSEDEKINGIWLIFNEYKEKYENHPFMNFFKTIIKDKNSEKSIKVLVDSMIKQEAYKKIKEEWKTIKGLKAASEKATVEFSDKADSVQKCKEKIMKQAITDNQAVFLETFYQKFQNNKDQVSIAREIFFISSQLKGELKKAFMLMFINFIKSKETLKEIPNEELYTPLVFFFFIREDSKKALNVLKNSNIFKIMSESIDVAKVFFSKITFAKIAIKIQELMKEIIEYVNLNSQLEFVNKNIVPILVKTAIKESPMPFNEEEFIAIFNRKGNTYFESQFQYYAAICKNKNNANMIYKIIFAEATVNILNSPSSSSITRSGKTRDRFYINFFHTNLLKVENLIIAGKNIDLKNEETNNAYSALLLLQKLCKYLDDNIKEDIIKFATGCQKEIDKNEEAAQFFKLISEFFWSPVFAPIAAKIIRDTGYLYPQALCKFFDEQFESRFTNIIKVIESTSNDDDIIASFIKISRQFLSASFKAGSLIEKLPHFIKFILQDNFPRIVHRKFQSIYSKWKILTSLIESCSDYAVISPEFVRTANTSEAFVSALITAVMIGISAINHNEVNTDDSTSSVDRTDISYVVMFEKSTLNFLHTIILKYLDTNEGVSPLCKVFFDENSEACSIFSSLISFLQVQLPENCKDNDLPGYALKMIEILCRIANRIGNASVDAFYSSDKQEIINKSIKENLLKSQKIAQSCDILDFISSTLMTQTAFSFSFIQNIGKIYMKVASSKLADLKNSPRHFLSFSRLLAHMWTYLPSNSKVLKDVSTNELWESALKAINVEFSDDLKKIESTKCAYYVLGISYLLRAYFLSIIQESNHWHIFNLKLSKIDFPNIIANVKSALNKCGLDKIYDSINNGEKLDVTRFLSYTHQYGPDFYIDIPLVEWYGYSSKFVKPLEDYNITLSQIDACSQLLSTVKSIVTMYISLIKEKKEKVFDKIKFANLEGLLDLFKFVITPFGKMMFPESTIVLVSELFIHSLQITRKEDLEKRITPTILNKVMELVNKYIDIKKTPQVFTVTGKVIDLLYQDEESKDEKLDLQQVEQLFYNSLRHAIDCKDYEAMLCAVSASHKLKGKETFLKNHSNLDLLKEAVIFVEDEKFGPRLYEIISLICMTTTSRNIIIQSGFAKTLCMATPQKGSPILKGILRFLNSIPLNSLYTKKLVIETIYKLVYMINDNNFQTEFQVSLTSFIVQVCHMCPEISNEFPNVVNSLLALIYKRLKKVFGLILSTSTETNVDYLIILRNCLLIINMQFEFPFASVAGFSDTLSNRTTTIEICKSIIDKFSAQRSLSKKSHEKEFIERISVSIFSAAGRLIVGLILMDTTKSDQTLEEIVNQLQRIFEGNNVRDISEKADFYETYNEFLKKLRTAIGEDLKENKK